MNPADFALDLRACLAPPQHIGINSGTGVVQPWLPTVCGVAECFSPPIAARGLKLEMEFSAGGHSIIDNGNTRKGDCGVLYAGGTWRPDGIERHGTYHHLINGRLISLAVNSRLVPLLGRVGYVLEVTVRNRGPAIEVHARPKLQPGSPAILPLDRWDFAPPAAGAAATEAGSGHWSNGAADVRLVQQGSARTLGTGDSAVWHTAVILTGSGEAFTPPGELWSLAKATEDAWNRRVAGVGSRLPLLRSSDEDLQLYYRRALASGLVCLWERDDFAINPFPATSGMDGGAICAYPWDLAGYPPRATAGLLGDGAKDFLDVMGRFGLDRHMHFTPAGVGMHHYYAYSTFSYIQFVWSMACVRGPDADVFRHVTDHFLAIESGLQQRDHLADYGTQRNLLEMRQSGWEHFVASPNAERAWCYDRLADLGDRLGLGDGAAWRAKAEQIRLAIRQQLWDADAGWFRCVYPDGHREIVYSIQGFDALRFGACTDAMAAAMLRHVRDGAFLGRYGVSSVSAEDERHYELNDPDWSGGGAYTGDGPILALTLYERGEPKLAWDVLRRFLWMGRHLPYFPQEHYCDRPATAGHKRSNIVSGLVGVEAILYGLIGLSPRIDGSLWITPQPPAGTSLAIEGYNFRGRQVDIRLDANGGEARVDGKAHRLTPGQATRLIQ